MRRFVRAVSSAPSKRRPPVLLIAMGTLAAIGLTIVVAGGHPREDTAPPSPAPTPDRRSAAGAALQYTQELAVTGVRHPGVYGPRLEQIAAPGSLARVQADFGKGAEEVRALVKGRSGVLRAAPMGYRIDAFDAGKAEVSVWMVALAGGPLLEPVAQWRVLTIDLVWTSAGWRVTGGHGAGGPSPRSSVAALATEAATFRAVNHVP